ncbi:MAG: carbohydrate ABC transporter permease [Clostridiaceae bacterium]|nr:carbohydrate ABC transporter permease [Clostridiaceae bacterium]
MRRNKKSRKILRGTCSVLILIWTLFPVYWMISLSIRDDAELISSLSLFPGSFTVKHFAQLFVRNNFLMAIINSLYITFTSLAFALILGLICSYILARARFKYKLKGPVLFWVLLVRVIPPIAFALPLYIMMNKFSLLNTKIPVILAHILVNIPFIIWYMLSFFSGLPEEVEESAEIDGASDMQLFARIVIPLVMPGITAVAILSFMTSWNEYLYGVIFVQSPSNFTIPLSLSTLNSEQELAQWGSIAAGGIISLVPIALFAIFAQIFLIQGLSSGAVKE